MYTVYMHECPNKKVYVGMTSRKPQERWNSKYKNNKMFSEDIKKYGWNNIKHIILFTGLTQEEAEKKEIEMIAFYDSTNKDKGYNLAKGGKSTNGYHHSEEAKNKIRNSLLGVKHTKERCEHQSISRKKLWENEDYRKRMSEAHKGKNIGKENATSKTVYQYSLENELIEVFESVGLAERKTGIDHRQISDCCNKKQITCHGFKWSYEKV